MKKEADQAGFGVWLLRPSDTHYLLLVTGGSCLLHAGMHELMGIGRRQIGTDRTGHTSWMSHSIVMYSTLQSG